MAIFLLLLLPLFTVFCGGTMKRSQPNAEPFFFCCVCLQLDNTRPVFRRLIAYTMHDYLFNTRTYQFNIITVSISCWRSLFESICIYLSAFAMSFDFIKFFVRFFFPFEISPFCNWMKLALFAIKTFCHVPSDKMWKTYGGDLFIPIYVDSFCLSRSSSLRALFLIY